jgi:hypothetical protein
MISRIWLATLIVTVLGCLEAGVARADRVPSFRTQGWRSSGARLDKSVPYLTTGTTAFIPGTYVGVRIYSATMVDDPWQQDVRPAYNLPFWGGIQAFSTRANGVMPTGLDVTPRELSRAVRPNAAMPVGTTLNSKGNYR